MKNVVLAGLGGFVGAALRYAVGAGAAAWGTSGRFPLATFLVNVFGCLAAGLLMAWATRYGMLTPPLRVLLFTGLLGGFTTLSAFGVETVQLLQRHEILVAVLYALGSVTAALVAVWIGLSAAR